MVFTLWPTICSRLRATERPLPGAETAEATVTTAHGTYTGPSGLPISAVTADSMDSLPGYTFFPGNVVDDNLGTSWSSAETPQPHWVQVQFSHPLQISKVVVTSRRFSSYVITSADVSTSVGGGALKTQATVSGNTAPSIPFTFAAPVSADTVRVTVNAETFDGAPRIEADIAEIQFYGPNGQLIEHPPVHYLPVGNP